MDKICRTCGLSKPLTEYYRHEMMADGYLNKCKDCVKERVTKHRAENLEAIQAYDRKRGLLPHRKAGVRARAHRYKPTPPKKGSIGRRARHMVSNALRDGFLIPEPCERLGPNCTGRIHAHHEDYSKPFDVTWLCTYHHGERHREINEALRSAAE